MTVTINGTTGVQVPLGSVSAPGVSNTTSSTTGIYNPTSTSLAIATNGTAAVTVDASQNVGIGTASPIAKINVKTLDGTNTAMFAGTTIGARYSSDASGMYIDGTDPTGGASYQPLFTGGSVFGVRISGTEKMRLDSSGNLQVGGTTVANTVGYVNSRTNARVWCNFNGTLTSPITPRASYNVSSVTKNGTGDYTVNFTTSLADANYCVSVTPASATAGNNSYGYVRDSTVYLVSSIRIGTGNTGASAVDASAVNVVVFGN